MTEPIMKRAKGDGVGIQLACWEGVKDNILCIHGLTANCRCWDRIIAGLAPEFRVLAMDLRGRGLSDKPSEGYSVEQHVRDIYCLLEDRKLERVTLMGHSLGAYISLAFAARHPDRVKKLILMDAGGHLSQSRWDNVHVAIKPSVDRLGHVFPSFEDYTTPLKQAPFLQPWTRFLDTYFHYEVEEMDGGVRSRTPVEGILEEISNIRGFDAASLYPFISCPVLILRATDGILSRDDMVLTEDAAERMVREIAHARRVDVKNTNHYSILFEANEMRDHEIRNFLEAQ
ncbi:MAG: alpha/beta hydrolase [Deltaproteobacteria bacterium]|nr:alpha/beta hydrolase [Deltaproteobacteria bacterium]